MDEFVITVFSLNPLNTALNHGDLLKDKIQIVTNQEHTTSKRNKLSYLRSMRALRQLYRQFNPDIVHAHYATSYGLLGKLLFHKKYFISVWGSDVYDFPRKSVLHKLIFSRIVSSAQQLFSTSHDMAKELSKYTSKSICVIPFGINVNLFQPEPKKNTSETKIIGTVKSLEKVYGIDRLIRAAAELKSEFPNLECHIYGEGSQKQELITLSRELGIENMVQFKGYVNNEKLPEVLRGFDVFCVLSRQESFGVAAVEAQACGIPVVATKVGGLPEIVVDGETGFTVEEEQSEIVKKISELLANDQLANEMGRNARRSVLEKYDWEMNLKTLKEFYRS